MISLRISRSDLTAHNGPATEMPLSYCHDTLDSPPGESRRGTGKDRAGRRDDDDDDLQPRALHHPADRFLYGRNPSTTFTPRAMAAYFELYDYASRALFAALRLDPSFELAFAAIVCGDESAHDALHCECGLHPDLFDIIEQLIYGERVSPTLSMTPQHQAAFGANLKDKILRIYNLPLLQRAAAGMLFAGCLITLVFSPISLHR